MAAGQNTYSSALGNQLTSEARIFYNMELIDRLKPHLGLLQHGSKETIPNNTGGFGSGEIQRRKFTISDTLSTTSDLVTVEGVAPDALNLSVVASSTQLTEYAMSLTLTKRLVLAGMDKCMDESIKLIGERMGQLIHLLTIAAIESGATNITYGGSATTTGTLTASDVLTSTVIKKAVRELAKRKAPKFNNTFYRCVVNPELTYDLSNDSQWRNVGEYNGGAADHGGPNLITGALGMIHGVEFFGTTDLTKLATGGVGGNVNYAKAFVFGEDPWTSYDFAGMGYGNIDPDTNLGVKVDAELPGKSSKADRHGMWGYAAAAVAFACKVWDADRIQQLNVAYSS
jgi:N4-gp56 family major capsid protein